MTKNTSFSTWFYAIRPHTLGASIAPMLVATAAILHNNVLDLFPLILCYIVAISAQIASNLANDLFDYLGGIDTEKRVGFERVLTQGRVSVRGIITALSIAVGICALAGLSLVVLKGWWVLAVGIPVLIGIFSYSAGPYPLSYHGLGDIAVVIFYGLVPVLTTYAIMGGFPPLYLICLAASTGFWQDNILVVNNYRDYEEDKQTGKHTLIVLLGRKSGPYLYLINALMSFLFLGIGLYLAQSPIGALVVSVVALLTYAVGYLSIRRLQGKRLNSLLVYTGRISVLIAIAILVTLLL